MIEVFERYAAMKEEIKQLKDEIDELLTKNEKLKEELLITKHRDLTPTELSKFFSLFDASTFFNTEYNDKFRPYLEGKISKVQLFKSCDKLIGEEDE